MTLYPVNTLADVTASAFALNGNFMICEHTCEAPDYAYLNADKLVWVYCFAYASACSLVPLHSAEQLFVWDNLVVDAGGPPSAADYAFSDTLVAYWSSFAETGDPNEEGLPTCRACSYAGAIKGVWGMS